MESSNNNQETHSWTDRHVQLIESALRHAEDVFAGAVNWDTVAKEAGYQDGTNAKVMYRRLLTSLKKSKAGPLTVSPRKVDSGKKANKDGNADDSSAKKENEGEDTEGQPAPKKHKYTKKPKERGAVPAESVNTPAVTEQRDDGVQV